MLIVLTFNLVNCHLVEVSVNAETLSASLAQKRTMGQAVVPQYLDKVCKVDSEIRVH